MNLPLIIVGVGFSLGLLIWIIAENANRKKLFRQMAEDDKMMKEMYRYVDIIKSSEKCSDLDKSVCINILLGDLPLRTKRNLIKGFVPVESSTRDGEIAGNTLQDESNIRAMNGFPHIASTFSQRCMNASDGPLLTDRLSVSFFYYKIFSRIVDLYSQMLIISPLK